MPVDPRLRHGDRARQLAHADRAARLRHVLDDVERRNDRLDDLRHDGSALAGELLVFDQMPIVLPERREDVEIQHRLVADRLAVVLDVRRYAHHAAGADLEGLARDDESHAARDDVDDLLERMAVRVGLHAGLQPVHDQQHVVAAKSRAGHTRADRLLRQLIPAVGASLLLRLHSHLCIVGRNNRSSSDIVGYSLRCRQMNIAAHMRRAGGAFAHHPAIAQGAAVLQTYGALADRVSRLAQALRGHLGLLLGERVALVLKNCPEYLEILYACWHAGLVAVPINAKLHPAEMAYILADSGARACFVSVSLGAELGALVRDPLRYLIDAGGAEYTRMLQCEPLPLTNCGADDIAWLFYTSGTTGRPKGASLSHRNLLAMSLCYFADVDQQSPWRAILHAAPMSHGSGLYALAHVLQASCHVIPESDGFDAAEVYALIGAWPESVFFAAPTMIRRLLDHPGDAPTANLKTILYGGGPMYLEDLPGGQE